MEALAKMFFGFLAKDPQMRAGVFQAIHFITGLDERMRQRDKAIFDRLKAIEERLGMPVGEAYIHAPLSETELPQLPTGPNGQAHQ